MARVQVDQIGKPQVNPVAAPVDRFVQTDAGQQLSQLAEALSGLAPELREFTDVTVASHKQKGTEKANEVFADIQKTGQQIKAGDLAAHESKYFRAAAKEQFGRLHARQFGTEITKLMNDPNGPLAESTDPAAFDKVVGGLRDEYLAANVGDADASFNSGFNAFANEEVLAARNTFAAQAGQRMEAQVIENTYQEHQGTIEAGIRTGQTWQQIAQSIYERNTIQYALNPANGKQLSNTMIKAVIDTAIKTENLDVLKLLDHIPGGPKGSKLANTSLANKLVPEAIKDIRGMRQQRYNLADKEDAQATEAALEGAFGGMYSVLDTAVAEGTDLSTINPQEFAEMVSKVDPTKVQSVYRAFEAYKNRVNVDDDATQKDLWSRAFRGNLTYEAVADAFEGKLLTVETSRKLRDEIKKSKGGRTRHLTEDPRLNETKTRLHRLFIDQWGINAPAMKLRAEFAVQDLENAWVQYRRGEGAGASDEQANDWLHNATTTFFGKHATPALRKALKGLDLPEQGSVGPQLVSWEKGAVVKPYEIGQLQAELQKFATLPGYRFSPRAEELMRVQGLKNMGDVEKFIARQKEFIPAGDTP